MQSGAVWNPRDTTSDLQGTGEYNNPNTPASQFWNYSGPLSAFQGQPHDIPCFGNLAGCTPYQVDEGGNPVLPPACANAAIAPYNGNSDLQGLALAALTNLGCFVQGGGVLTPPAFGTVGNAGRNLFRSLPYENLDLSVFKEFRVKERVTAQFRAEFFNVLNRPAFLQPDVVDPESGLGFGCTCTAASGGNPVLSSGGPRAIQLGLKFIF